MTLLRSAAAGAILLSLAACTTAPVVTPVIEKMPETVSAVPPVQVAYPKDKFS